MATPIVVDTSKYDRVVDWKTAFDSRPNLAGAIIRHGIGFEGDAFFHLNAVHIGELGKPWSPYFTIVPHFDLKLQLEYIHAVLHAIDWKCEGYLIPPSPEVPNGVLNRLWVDCEIKPEFGRVENAAHMKTMLDMIEDHLNSGHTGPNTVPGQTTPGVYTNQSWWQSYVGNQTWAKRHKLWVANPGSVVPAMPPGWDEYELFQYTWEGNLDGFMRKPKADLSKPFVRISGTYKASVTASIGLRVRTGPSTSFPILRTLPFGTVVTVYEERLGWAKISRDAEEWCSKMYLQVLP